MIVRKTAQALAIVLGAVAGLAAATAQAYDYPTVDRVEFVHMCQREYPDKPPHEMLYKCACVIDKFGETTPYDDFVESSTAYYASSIAGERGQVIRNERVAKALADSFREQLGKARKACFIN
ncbi:MAG: hypothetical protein ACT6T0_00135 [Nevskia sp.]|jgi:hypothetical protein|uniref:hypothetical protein n=1 Tax=Nevskia sp. TaxID=1929292 RepID=UPI00403505B2